MTADEGPIQTVGWGHFALPGERKRLRQKEAARLAEMKNLRAESSGNTEPKLKSPTLDDAYRSARESIKQAAKSLKQAQSEEERSNRSQPSVGNETVPVPVDVTVEEGLRFYGNKVAIENNRISKTFGIVTSPDDEIVITLTLTPEEWKNPLVVQEAIRDQIAQVTAASGLFIRGASVRQVEVDAASHGHVKLAIDLSQLVDSSEQMPSSQDVDRDAVGFVSDKTE